MPFPAPLCLSATSCTGVQKNRLWGMKTTVLAMASPGHLWRQDALGDPISDKRLHGGDTKQKVLRGARATGGMIGFVGEEMVRSWCPLLREAHPSRKTRHPLKTQSRLMVSLQVPHPRWAHTLESGSLLKTEAQKRRRAVLHSRLEASSSLSNDVVHSAPFKVRTSSSQDPCPAPETLPPSCLYFPSRVNRYSIRYQEIWI
ncbi:hypothetical protein VTK73DRAFT_8220 [Phialemonium thermophilum]|uniref:Uncharacterized protein n=1 Tax=Phialemonium thermophilum TaxID=223376 RepID=A0ABR3WA68_9PEZI